MKKLKFVLLVIVSILLIILIRFTYSSYIDSKAYDYNDFIKTLLLRHSHLITTSGRIIV